MPRAIMLFVEKLKVRARRLKSEATALYFAAHHPNTPWYAKLFILMMVAYALSPIDLIPDFIPVLGLVDEVVLLPLGITLALRMVPAEVIAECRARATIKGRDGILAGRMAAIVIVLLWLTSIVLATIWIA